jgi:hypothetical protein
MFDIISRGILLVNNTTVKILINRILVYSAMKISANILLLYSVLNPDTNSDSPSAKSNGVRFVSARFVINQIIDSGIIDKIIQDLMLMEVEDISID